MRSRLPSQLQRVGAGAVVLASAALWCACAAVQHAANGGDYAGTTLATSSPAGAERLELERAYDSAVGQVIATQGQPTYLHVVDRDQVYLFYPAADRVVIVTREGLPPGDVLVKDRIPGHFFRLLPVAEVHRIQAKRAARLAAEPAARRRSAPPAAPAPVAHDSGVRLADFDWKRLIERFREPLSAADPGVSGWHVATLPGGGRAGLAHLGGTEYRIQGDVVSAAVPIGTRSRSTPVDARTGYARVNRAVFGTRAPAVSQSVEPLVDQVAADPSGRTRFVRRVAGRTVSVARDPRRGLLIYRVHAD